MLAPFAVKLALLPAHIVTELTVTGGNGKTVTLAIAVALHIIQLLTVPITVYEVVEDGDTVMELVVAPLLHV